VDLPHVAAPSPALLVQPAAPQQEAEHAKASKKRLGLLLGGICLLVVAIVVVVAITTSSPKGIFPAGAGTGDISWPSATGSGSYNTSPVPVAGSMQGLAVNATVSPDQCCGEVRGSITGTIGSISFTATLTKGFNYGAIYRVVGSYAGQPLSGTAVQEHANTGNTFKIHGVIEGQPISGTLTGTQQFNPQSFSFTGTVGNLSVTGTASTSGNGFTSSQQVG
jgi:hypothetical protein